ncbi:MAG: hypothetical protein ACJA2S_000862 [Cyclobacteriaceae bacterium]|jgi:hypothetical protein
MVINSALFNKIFQGSIDVYHETDSIETPCPNPYQTGNIEHILFAKNWIDTVQWHMEDLIRVADINPKEALRIKRDIDSSNQDRTDTVEKFEDFLFSEFKEVQLKPDARVNTETPGWAMDRLSILNLKLYHFKEELNREGISAEHYEKCKRKVEVLEEQYLDLSNSIDHLLQEIASGKCEIKVYRQMKMYNDEELNPMLRKKQSQV